MKTTLQLECESGILIVGDPAVRAAISEELAYWIEVLADPDGRSQVAADFAEPWSDVQVRANREFRRLTGNRACALIAGPPGRYSMRMESGATASAPETPGHARAFVRLDSDLCEVFDPADPAVVAQFLLAAGTYEAGIEIVAGSGESTVGIYGNLEHPALRIEFRASSEAGGTRVVALSSARLTSAPAPGLLCRGRIKRVEDSIAIVNLRLSERLWSGYGRLRLSENDPVGAGSEVLVRLREHTGSFWWCELPAEPAD